MRLVLAAGAAALLASCSAPSPSVTTKQRSKEFFSERHYGPASPRVVTSGKVPKGGGRAMVGEPYRVAGKTYIPRDNPRYSATGLASWYGSAFHGRLTANGEVYDVNGLTAAHPTLPLPSYVRVTNLENGRALTVRVNDRGPFANDRIIDLSSRVAELLDVKNKGTAKVKVDYVGPARMDGLDEKMLLASYSGPGTFDRRGRDAPQGAVMVAAAKPAPPPAPRQRPSVLPAPDIMPAYAPDQGLGDELGPLIMRASLAMSYAPDQPSSAAQDAVAAMAAPAGAIPAAHTSRASGTIVQLGVFANAANAERLAASFERFGAVESRTQERDGRTLTAVRVVLTDAVAPEAVLAAAKRAGLAGAYLTDR